MNKLRKHLGLRIRELRKRKGWSQEELAEKIDVETTSLCNLENGKHFPKEGNLEKLANALDVEIQELFAFGQQKTGKILLADIAKLLETAEENEIKLIYRLILAVLR